jgi:drug/metabolite transporter superfamily protein YnfA
MNAVMGCLAPENWWADQRAKRRTVVLVIVLLFYVWLTTVEHLTVLEAAGMVVVIGVAAGVVLDLVVEGRRVSNTELSTLVQALDPGRP